jgi:hypothetical protein
MVGMGFFGGNTAQFLPKLNIEVSMLVSEFANMRVPLNELLQGFQDVSQGAQGIMVAGALSQPGPMGGLATLAIRIAYVAVLKEAVDKATLSRVFNVETAINDLLLHLESVRKLASVPATAAAGSAGMTIELSKLRDMVDGRQELFQLLNEMMRNYNETAKGTVSNMR